MRLSRVAEMLGLSEEQAFEECVLFAYANAAMENPAVTLDMVREAAVERWGEPREAPASPPRPAPAK